VPKAFPSRTCIRQERFEETIVAQLKRINIAPEEEPLVAQALSDFKKREGEVARKVRSDVETELSRIQESANRLLQKFLDNEILKEMFDEANTSLLMQRKACEEKMQSLGTEQEMYNRISNFLDELRNMCGAFFTAHQNQMRKVTERVCESITTNGSAIINLSLSPLMAQVAAREKTVEGWNTLLPTIYQNMA